MAHAYISFMAYGTYGYGPEPEPGIHNFQVGLPPGIIYKKKTVDC